MIEPNFVDEIDCSSFFDHIDDLLDFPADDAATADASLPVAAAENYEAPAASFFPAEMSDALPASGSAFPGDAAATDLSAELSVPYEDIVQLEWLSNFVEDSFSGGGSLTMKKVDPPSCTTTTTTTTNDFQFQISSPVSVLETTNSCSAADNTTAVPFSPEIYIPVPPCVRARSKRHRPAPSNNNNVATSKASSLSDYDENNLTEHNNNNKKFKKMKRKSNKVGNNPLAELDDDSDEKNEGGVMRKCMHCEISKTPQWRAGPMGPKTLCNACGVRYKSGRLFPEYRPAASPTFCPAVHSNSHKKVLEMRIKIGKGSSSGLAHTN